MTQQFADLYAKVADENFEETEEGFRDMIRFQCLVGTSFLATAVGNVYNVYGRRHARQMRKLIELELRDAIRESQAESWNRKKREKAQEGKS